MNRLNLADTLQTLNVLPVAAVTSTGNGSAIDLQSYGGDILFVADVSAPVAGTNPTMDLSIEESDASGSGFAAIPSSAGVMTQVTDTAAVRTLSLSKDSLKRYIRVVKTIGGTMSPQYLISVKAYTIKKNPA